MEDIPESQDPAPQPFRWNITSCQRYIHYSLSPAFDPWDLILILTRPKMGLAFLSSGPAKKKNKKKQHGPNLSPIAVQGSHDYSITSKCIAINRYLFIAGYILTSGWDGWSVWTQAPSGYLMPIGRCRLRLSRRPLAHAHMTQMDLVTPRAARDFPVFTHSGSERGYYTARSGAETCRWSGVLPKGMTADNEHTGLQPLSMTHVQNVRPALHRLAVVRWLPTVYALQ